MCVARATAPLLLVAAGGLARETAMAARLAGRTVLGFLDDNPALVGCSPAPGLTVLGSVDEFASYPQAEVVVCAGKGPARVLLVDRLREQGLDEARFGTVVHPSVDLSGDVTVGPGSVLLTGVVMTAAVTVGRHVVCMPHVVATHDDRLADFATLCAGVVLGGDVVVGEGAYLGMACSVREGRLVGAGARVGMGAVVVTDVPAGETWAGVPARRLHPPR